MKIKILDSARNDLINAYNFYEDQGAGLGSYFLDSLISDVDSLEKLAGIHSIHFGKYYRSLSKRFPFAIYYLVENDEVLIYAIVDCRTDPVKVIDRFE